MAYGPDTAKLLRRIEEYCSETKHQERNAGVEEAFALDLALLDVHSLPDLRALPPIKTLRCYNTNLRSLPPFPEMLEQLYCGPVESPVLPELPSTLQVLFIGTSGLSTLPDPLPPCLKQLSLWKTSVTTLPPLPSTLEHLSIDQSPISVIPPLPPSLLYLSCKYTNVSVIPALPTGLLRLECDSNPQITHLPRLPPSLKGLWCRGTNVTDLPSLPSSLEELMCNETNVRVLPDLPPLLFRTHPLDIYGVLGRLHFDRYSHPSLERGIDESFQDFVLRWNNWYSKERTQKRTSLVAEDLIAATWHPDRFEQWCLDEEEKKENEEMCA